MQIDNIIDTSGNTFGLHELKRYQDFYQSRTPETLRMQQSTKKKWLDAKEILHQRARAPLEIINEWKLKQLSWLVDFAYENVPFYKKLYKKVGFELGGIRTWNDFKALPIIDKDILFDQDPTDLLSPLVNFEKSPGLRTSGSSGKPLTVILNDSRVEWDFIERLRMYELMMGANFNTDDWIYSIDNNRWWLTSMEGWYPVFNIKTNCPINLLYNHIIKLKPRIVSGTAHIIIDLLEYRGAELSKYVKHFSTHSESSSVLKRRKYEVDFGISVTDEYSSEELGLIAYECPKGNYHLLEDSVHLETAEVDSDISELIGTELWNTGMPTIRYCQGDLGVISDNDTCDCGEHFRLLRNFNGRADQSLWSLTKGWISPMNIVNLGDELLVPQKTQIDEFKVIQKTKNEIVVEYRCQSKNGMDNDAMYEFCRGLKHIIGERVSVKAEKVHTFSVTLNHKRQTIYNLALKAIKNDE